MVSIVELSDVFLIVILPLSASTASAKLRTMLLSIATAVALSVGELLLNVGTTPSMTNALLAAKEPVAPGEASVSVALLPAASLIVPPLSASADVEA